MQTVRLAEEWKAVKGYEGLYEVSNTGKVRSIDRVIIRKNGKAMKCKGRELFFTVSKVGIRSTKPRASVQLWKNGKAKLIYVHRLVAEAFIPNPENKPQVNHIDGNPLNNNVSNLEWMTVLENVTHAFATGLMNTKHRGKPFKTRRVLAYNPDTGEEIITDSCTQMAKELGCSQTLVSKIALANEKVDYCKARGFIVQYL